MRLERSPQIHVAFVIEFRDAEGNESFASWGLWPEISLANSELLWNAINVDDKTRAKYLLYGLTAATYLTGSWTVPALGLATINTMGMKMANDEAAKNMISVCFPDVLITRLKKNKRKWTGTTMLGRQRFTVHGTISSNDRFVVGKQHLQNQLFPPDVTLGGKISLRDWLKAHLNAVESQCHTPGK